MRSLVLLIDSDGWVASLMNAADGSVQPVYDINDRMSRKYSFALCTAGRNIALSGYAVNLARAKQPLSSMAGEYSHGVCFTHNFMQPHIDGSLMPGNISTPTALAWLLGKVIFDAGYVSGFESFSDLYCIALIPDPDGTIETCFTSAAALVDHKLKLRFLSFQDLPDTGDEPLMPVDFLTGHEVLIQLFGQTLYFSSAEGKMKFRNSYNYGSDHLLQAFQLFLQSAAGWETGAGPTADLMLQSVFRELLSQLDQPSQENELWLSGMANGKALRLDRTECLAFLQREWTHLATLWQPDRHPDKTPPLALLSDYGYPGLIRQMISEIMHGKRLTRLTAYPADAMRHVFSRYFFRYYALNRTGSHSVFSKTMQEVQADYEMTYYDEKSDDISRLKLFKTGQSIPAYSTVIVQGRFSYQDRIYFEIIKDGADGAYARIAVSGTGAVDLTRAITLQLRFTYTRDDRIHVEANEHFSGKRLELLQLNQVPGGDQEYIRQKAIFKSARILNNYMDKKKEQSLGIF